MCLCCLKLLKIWDNSSKLAPFPILADQWQNDQMFCSICRGFAALNLASEQFSVWTILQSQCFATDMSAGKLFSGETNDRVLCIIVLYIFPFFLTFS